MRGIFISCTFGIFFLVSKQMKPQVVEHTVISTVVLLMVGPSNNRTHCLPSNDNRTGDPSSHMCSSSNLAAGSAILVPLDGVKPLTEDEQRTFERAMESARDVVVSCFDRFPVEKIGVSFNGGKDSVVMLELLIAHAGLERLSGCHFFMFGEPDEFAEIYAFREWYLRQRIPTAELRTLPHHYGIKSGLEMLRNEHGLEAVFIGTRKDDPSAQYQKTSVEPTTPGWPAMMRYCPVFEMCFHDVWWFLATRRVPVCRLYECGFTSLGRVDQTVPNPALLVTSEEQQPTSNNGDPASVKNRRYLPAWCLPDATRERDCRLTPAKSGL